MLSFFRFFVHRLRFSGKMKLSHIVSISIHLTIWTWNQINQAKLLQLQFKVELNQEYQTYYIRNELISIAHNDKERKKWEIEKESGEWHYFRIVLFNVWWDFTIRKLIQKVSSIQTYSHSCELIPLDIRPITSWNVRFQWILAKLWRCIAFVSHSHRNCTIGTSSSFFLTQNTINYSFCRAHIGKFTCQFVELLKCMGGLYFWHCCSPFSIVHLPQFLFNKDTFRMNAASTKRNSSHQLNSCYSFWIGCDASIAFLVLILGRVVCVCVCRCACRL